MIEDIRIVVILTDANPELLQEFVGISPRARAERLRSLATLGLSVSRGGMQAQLRYPHAASPEPLPPQSGPQVPTPRKPKKVQAPQVKSVETPMADIEQQPSEAAKPAGQPQGTGRRRNSTLAKFVRSLG